MEKLRIIAARLVVLTLLGVHGVVSFAGTCTETDGVPRDMWTSADNTWFETPEEACAFWPSSTANTSPSAGRSFVYLTSVSGTVKSCFFSFNGMTANAYASYATATLGTNKCKQGFSNVSGTCTRTYSCDQEACPGGQFRRTQEGTCEDKCPAEESNGPVVYPAGVPANGILCMTRQDFAFGVGWYNTTGVGVTEIKCKARATDSMIVCYDKDANGTSQCYSDTSRIAGSSGAGDTGECTVKNNLPVSQATPTVCESGETWCKSSTGFCGSGFTAGTINGESYCMKTGAPQSLREQTFSRLSPPTTRDLNDPPTEGERPASPDSASGSEGLTPADRTVLGIGTGAANGEGGAGGTGAGGGGSGEQITPCGLPDSPPCKIDEEGTPEGTGFGDTEKGAVDTAAASITTKISDIESGTGAPNSGWGFTISFPSSCSPISIGNPFTSGSIVLDFCQWQAVVWDLMSMIWASFTLWICLGMVSRAAQGA